MENLKDLVREIKETKTQNGASQKDELRVMKAMLNDRGYEVGIYTKEGEVGTLNPSKEARELISTVIASAAKIPTAEAEKLAEVHEFKKSEAVNMINISKEFINTYLETERKLPLGGRATSNSSLIKKNVEESSRTYPKKVGVNEDGTYRYEHVPVTVKAHTSVRVIAPCPEWV